MGYHMSESRLEPAKLQRLPGSPWKARDAAKFLGISERHLARLVADGKVESFQLGSRRFLTDAEVRRVAEGGA